VSLILVVAACGGASDSSSDPTSSSLGATSAATVATSPQAGAVSETTIEVAVDAEVEAVVAAVVAAHGEDGGFDAVIWSLERGYSTEQLFAGALQGRLQADGVIIAGTGGTEGPAGSPLGLIVLPDLEPQSLGITVVPAAYRAASHLSAAFEPMTMQEYKEKFADAELTALMILIIGAARTGYSGQQIIEIVIEGGRFDRLDLEERTDLMDGSVSEETRTCDYFRDLTGQIVLPAFEAPVVERSSGCRDAISDLVDKEKAALDVVPDAQVETPEAPGSDEPSIGSLTATGGVVYEDSSSVATNEIELTLAAGGGTVTGTMLQVYVDTDEGGGTFTVSADFEGTWDPVTGTLSVTGTATNFSAEMPEFNASDLPIGLEGTVDLVTGTIEGSVNDDTSTFPFLLRVQDS